jgi:NifU-like protein involved in Fe-S cluster formation
MVIGMDIAQARAVTREEIAEALGGLPASKMHCSVLAADAIRAALKDFR